MMLFCGFGNWHFVLGWHMVSVKSIGANFQGPKGLMPP